MRKQKDVIESQKGKSEEVNPCFAEEMIKAGMKLNLTEVSQNLLLDHTHQLAILNKRLCDLIDVLSKPATAMKLKKKVTVRVLAWVIRNLLRGK